MRAYAFHAYTYLCIWARWTSRNVQVLAEADADFVVVGTSIYSYLFSGMATGNNSNLTLLRGSTYTFRITNAIFHPFCIQNSERSSSQTCRCLAQTRPCMRAHPQ